LEEKNLNKKNLELISAPSVVALYSFFIGRRVSNEIEFQAS
jgi:hypothetical protein